MLQTRKRSYLFDVNERSTLAIEVKLWHTSHLSTLPDPQTEGLG
jgi:hypothetical protein